MVVASVNPHGFGFSGPFKAALAVKIDRTAISDKHVLVKALVVIHEHLHQAGANSPLLIIREDQEMGIIHDEKAVRNGITQSNQSVVIPSGH